MNILIYNWRDIKNPGAGGAGGECAGAEVQPGEERGGVFKNSGIYSEKVK